MGKELKMGVFVTDAINGFSGYVTGKAEYLTGCTQFLVSPTCEKPSERPAGEWIDEARLIVKEDVMPIALPRTPKELKDKGGPQSNPAPVR